MFGQVSQASKEAPANIACRDMMSSFANTFPDPANRGVWIGNPEGKSRPPQWQMCHFPPFRPWALGDIPPIDGRMG